MELELEAVTELHRAAVPIVAPADEDEAERLYQMALKESAEMSAAEARAVLRKARDQAGASAQADRNAHDDGGKDADPGDDLEGPGASGGSKRGSVESGAAEDAELLQALDLNLMELEMQNRQFELEQQVGGARWPGQIFRPPFPTATPIPTLRNRHRGGG